MIIIIVIYLLHGKQGINKSGRAGNAISMEAKEGRAQGYC
jgi:hypothetical protein